MSQYYKVTAYVGTPHRNAVEVTLPLVGPAGPAGPAGTGLETLTAPGDTLYQGQSTGERLPIGSSGQVLKVVNGFPAWGNESGAVTSVNGETGAVVLSRNDIGATLVFSEIEGTSQNPTQIEVASFYNAATKSINVAVMLNSADANSHGSVFLPLLDNESVGRVSIRLNTNGNSPSLLRVQTTDGEGAVNVFPPSLFSTYDEISSSQDYVFVWIGDRWDLEILAREASTTAQDLRKPEHNGQLAAWGFDGIGTAGPATPTSPGVAGQLAWGFVDGAQRLYICVATNTWRRVPITTWS
jgi:hypothetical protein